MKFRKLLCDICKKKVRIAEAKYQKHRRLKIKVGKIIKGKKEIVLVMRDKEPIPKEYFYHHDVPIDEDPGDDVVELKWTVIKVVEK